MNVGNTPLIKLSDKLYGKLESVNQLLIENGHAYEYDGGKKKVFGG